MQPFLNSAQFFTPRMTAITFSFLWSYTYGGKKLDHAIQYFFWRIAGDRCKIYSPVWCRSWPLHDWSPNIWAKRRKNRRPKRLLWERMQTMSGKANGKGGKIPHNRGKVQYFVPAFSLQNVISSQFELTTVDHGKYFFGGPLHFFFSFFEWKIYSFFKCPHNHFI